MRGTATAASIWNTGAIGLAVAFDRYEIAIVLGLVNFATLRWLTPLVHEVEPETLHALAQAHGRSDRGAVRARRDQEREPTMLLLR